MTVYSVITEITDITKALEGRQARKGKNECTDKEFVNAGGAEIYFALGGDGDPVGDQSHGGAGACASVPVAAPAAGGRDFRDPGGGAFEREHQPARAARMADCARGSRAWGPAGSF